MSMMSNRSVAADRPRWMFACTVVRRFSDGIIVPIAVNTATKTPGEMLSITDGRVPR
jgi:hypothetical protein